MKVAPRYDGPPILTISGPADDQRAPVIRQRRRMAALLADLSAQEWAAPSRCAGWTVRDVVAHLVGVNAFWQASVTAGLAGAPTRVLAGFDPVATPPLMVDAMSALSAAEVLDRFVTSTDGFLATLVDLDDPGWLTLAELPPGHLPIRLLAQHALWDSWIHERDIALALGRAPALEDDEVASGLRYAAVLGPVFAISAGEGGALGGAFSVDATDPDLCFVVEVGDAVDLHDGSAPAAEPCLRGDAVELLEALSLRVPLPPSAPTEWRQLLSGLATVFDSDMPLG